MTTLIAHISDPHIIEPGERLGGILDTAHYLEQAVAHLNAMDSPPDAVIVTGDLTDNGSDAQYQHFCDIMANLHAPWWVVCGNHDDTATAGDTLADHLAVGGPRPGCGSIDIDGVELHTLNTAVPGEPGGHLDDAQLQWLHDTLHTRAGYPHPVFVALHHPPVDVGLAGMDQMRLDNTSTHELGSIMAGADVAAVLCGHLHRTTITAWADTLVISAPSVAHSIAFNVNDDAPLSFALENPAALIHRIDGNHVTTHHIQIGYFPAKPVEPGQ